MEQEPKRILIVEDHKPTADILKHLIQRDNRLACDVTIAATMADALQCLREHAYDALIVDNHFPAQEGSSSSLLLQDMPIPENPGIFLVETVRRGKLFAHHDTWFLHPRNRQVPIYFHSSILEESLQRAAKEAGATVCAAKPEASGGLEAFHGVTDFLDEHLSSRARTH